MVATVVSELVLTLVVNSLEVLSVLEVNEGVPSVVVSGVRDMTMLFDVPVDAVAEVVRSVVL